MKYIKVVTIIIILVAVLLTATSEFTVNLDVVSCKKDVAGNEFRPLAYQIIHNDKQLESILQYNNSLKDIDFDFKNYSYLITFGKAAKCIKYSIYDTIFNDKSPSFCRLILNGKLKANIIYKDNDMYCMYKDPIFFEGDGYIYISLINLHFCIKNMNFNTSFWNKTSDEYKKLICNSY